MHKEKKDTGDKGVPDDQDDMEAFLNECEEEDDEEERRDIILSHKDTD